MTSIFINTLRCHDCQIVFIFVLLKKLFNIFFKHFHVIKAFQLQECPGPIPNIVRKKVYFEAYV